MNLMKRVLLSIVAIGFGLFIVLFSARQAGLARAQELEMTETEIETETETETRQNASDLGGQADSTQMEMNVDYYLPYPGILPDHPLYVLKMIRDRIKVMLAQNENQKMETLLLLGDKRIGAARALWEGGKKDVAVETALKAEKYLDRSVSAGQVVDEQESWQRLAVAAAKHGEILGLMSEDVSDEDRQVLEQAEAINSAVEERIREQSGVEYVPEVEEEDEVGEVNGTDEAESEDFYPVEISL